MTVNPNTGEYVPNTPFDWSDVRTGLPNMSNFNANVDAMAIAHVAFRTAEYLGFSVTKLTVEEALRLISPVTAEVVDGVPT